MAGRLGLAAIAAVVVAYLVMVQGPGWNQNAHYALVRTLATGTATVDQTRYQTGPWYQTGDVTFYRGHYYAAKAPGLALAALPAYLPLKAAGVWDSGDSTRMLWFLGLWAVILPAAVLLLLVRRAGEKLQPGTGTVVAVTLGVGTLVLPFSTLFFSHVLSATLGFAAFSLLLHEREGAPRLRLVAAAGVLAGLATTVEYPLAIIGVLLGVYAISRTHVVERGIAYSAGAIAGSLPLFAFQWWAYGSPTHFAYSDVVGGLNRTGIFGVGVPSFRVAMELLFSNIGLLRLSPVLALAVVGVILLYRQGSRAEALLVTAVAVAYLAFNSGYETPFGGWSPGPRFLIATLPFLAVALGPVFARRPLTTLLLAAPSIVLMVAVTITHPLENVDAQWFQRIRDSDFSATVVGLFSKFPLDNLDLPSSSHWYPLLLFGAPLLLALGFAAAEHGTPRLAWADALGGVACLVGWLVVQRKAPAFLSGHGVSQRSAPALVLLLAVAVGVFAAALAVVFGVDDGSPRERESPEA